MVRSSWIVSIAVFGLACRPTQPPAAPAHDATLLGTPSPPPQRAHSPADILGAQHHVPVTIEASVAVPGGTVAVYTYDRLESQLGALSAAGRDAVAELAAAQGRCEAERAALDPDDREYIESEYPSCSERAAAVLFEDDQLSPECRTLAVATFDAKGALLHSGETYPACLYRFGGLDPYDLTPLAEPELMLNVTYAVFGELTRGGWGQTELSTQLHVLAIEADLDGHAPFVVVEQLAVELGVSQDHGACSGGMNRSLRVATVGTIEVFSQQWSECGDEDCIDPTDEGAADVDPSMLCQDAPVTAERSVWQADPGQWGAFETRAYEGSVLPDGVM